jgi:hypothetical protein
MDNKVYAYHWNVSYQQKQDLGVVPWRLPHQRDLTIKAKSVIIQLQETKSIVLRVRDSFKQHTKRVIDETAID